MWYCRKISKNPLIWAKQNQLDLSWFSPFRQVDRWISAQQRCSSSLRVLYLWALKFRTNSRTLRCPKNQSCRRHRHGYLGCPGEVCVQVPTSERTKHHRVLASCSRVQNPRIFRLESSAKVNIGGSFQSHIVTLISLLCLLFVI
jgi:hypothetical protein